MNKCVDKARSAPEVRQDLEQLKQDILNHPIMHKAMEVFPDAVPVSFKKEKEE